MKIFHTSDLHLYSSMTSRIPSDKLEGRKRDLLLTFKHIADTAEAEGVRAVVIAGDLFDRDSITERQAKEAARVFSSHPGVAFYYLPGNHERAAFLPAAGEIPNLFVFGEERTEFLLDGVRFVGQSKIGPGFLDGLDLPGDTFNVAVLHGDLVPGKSTEGAVGLADLPGHGIDYLALGHYHTYAETPFREGVAVYSGTPEGRGFDEAGEKGFVEIDTEQNTHRFRPCSRRTVREVTIDATGFSTVSEYADAARAVLADLPDRDIVRARVTGRVDLADRHAINIILEMFLDKFYVFSVKDERKIDFQSHDYSHDPTLKGEFVRLVLADGELSDADRAAVMECGLCALAGERWEG